MHQNVPLPDKNGKIFLGGHLPIYWYTKLLFDFYPTRLKTIAQNTPKCIRPYCQPKKNKKIWRGEI